MIPFGSQLIGQTEKSLNALLRTVLIDRQLSEREWVTLRLTSQSDGSDALVDIVRDRARFADAADLVTALQNRGLILDEALTPAGADLVDDIGREIGTLTAPIWASVDPADAAAAARALTVVLEQSRARLRE